MRWPGFELDDFYAATWPRLVRTAYAVCGDRGVAEDAAQTALAKAYRSRRRISRSMPRRPTSARWRSTRCSTTVAAHRPPGGCPGDLPDAVLEAVDPTVHDEIWQAVLTLPPRQRAVLVLRYYEDLSEQQIADVLGCRPGTVKSQASAALATLRSRLDDRPGPRDRCGVGGRPARRVRGLDVRRRLPPPSTAPGSGRRGRPTGSRPGHRDLALGGRRLIERRTAHQALARWRHLLAPVGLTSAGPAARDRARPGADPLAGEPVTPTPRLTAPSRRWRQRARRPSPRGPARTRRRRPTRRTTGPRPARRRTSGAARAPRRRHR